jgi:FkbM family methyltransferase
MDNMIVVDIGAHIGAFAVACLNRGAKEVHCFEPDPENFQVLEANVTEAEDANPGTGAVLYRAGVTGIDVATVGIRHLTDHDYDKGRNTGHNDIFGDGDEIDAIPVTKILTELVPDMIDLLKIDCEGAEWSIFASGDFTRVRRIVGELHMPPDIDNPMLNPFRGKPLNELCDELRANLESQGFHVSVIPDSHTTAKIVAMNQPITEVKDRKPKLLWVGDAIVPTGYGHVTDHICTRLVAKGWDVRVLGIGYIGDPHNKPYKIYPALDPFSGSGAVLGHARLQKIIQQLTPDICVIQHDSWNVGGLVDTMAMNNVLIPTIGYVAVDSENVRADVASQLRNCKHVICHTQFGIEQLQLAGFTGPTSIAGHGVDMELFQPYNREEAREGLPIPHKDPFIFGAVAANQPRKRLDLTIAYWAAWWHQAGKPDNAYLYLHTNDDGCWDLRQIATYCGVRSRLFRTDGGQSLRENELPTLFNSFDCVLSTAEGESFGIPILQAAACGIPTIAVHTGGAPSWVGDQGPVYWVKPSSYQFTSNRTNTKRGIASEEDFVKAMNVLYSNPKLREEMGRKGIELAKRFNWDDITQHFHNVLDGILKARQNAKKVSSIQEFE